MTAIDRDAPSLERLAERSRQCGLADKFKLVAGDLLDVRSPGDVVVLELCLHEMAEPERALAHARGMAPDLLLMDHAPGAPWSWCATEDRGVEVGWKAVERGAIRRQEIVVAWQHFPYYAALEARLALQGPESRDRIRPHRGRKEISIPMPFRLALL